VALADARLCSGNVTQTPECGTFVAMLFHNGEHRHRTSEEGRWFSFYVRATTRSATFWFPYHLDPSALSQSRGDRLVDAA